jgi:hypothetical protein
VTETDIIELPQTIFQGLCFTFFSDHPFVKKTKPLLSNLYSPNEKVGTISLEFWVLCVQPVMTSVMSLVLKVFGTLLAIQVAVPLFSPFT